MQLKKDEQGKYLGKFDTRREAREYIDKLVKRYLHTPHQKKMTLRKLVRDAEDEGVTVYHQSLSRWFKDKGIELKKNKPRESYKKRKSFTLSHEVCNRLDEFPDGYMSYLAEIGLRIIMGLRCYDVVVYIPSDDEEEQIVVIFKEITKGNYEAIIKGDINMRDKQQIRVLTKKAEEQGVEAIKKYAKTFGWRYFGGDQWDKK